MEKAHALHFGAIGLSIFFSEFIETTKLKPFREKTLKSFAPIRNQTCKFDEESQVFAFEFVLC